MSYVGKSPKFFSKREIARFLSGSIGFMSQLCVSSGNTTKLILAV